MDGRGRQIYTLFPGAKFIPCSRYATASMNTHTHSYPIYVTFLIKPSPISQPHRTGTACMHPPTSETFLTFNITAQSPS